MAVLSLLLTLAACSLEIECPLGVRRFNQISVVDDITPSAYTVRVQPNFALRVEAIKKSHYLSKDIRGSRHANICRGRTRGKARCLVNEAIALSNAVKPF